MNNTKCSYFGCTKNISNTETNIKDGMKFCEDHLKECSDLIKEENFDPKKLISFWIKAQGGAKRAAERTLNGVKNE